jgi:hypothetical protein
MAAKRDFASLLVSVELPPSMAHATSEYRSSWVLRALAAASPEEGASVFDAEDGLFAEGERLEGMAERFWGAACFRLRGPDPGRMSRAAQAAGFVPMEALPACERIEARAFVPAAHAREAESTFRAWLGEARIGFIEEASGPARRLRPSARSAKKKMLVEAQLLGFDPSAGGDAELRLILGRKARLAEWLSRMSLAARRSTSIRFIRY